MSQEKVVKCECDACGGTGLYLDWTCHEGAAIVCRKCAGTGALEIRYIPFTGRKEAKGVKRVFKNVAWKHVFPAKHTFDDGTTIDYSKYGCTLEEWEAGVEPKPLFDK